MSGLLALGFLIGMRHALEADHVAAVATLATRAKTPAECIRHGVCWGIGHTVTLFLFGTVVLLIDTVTPNRLAAALELAVGIMLVILGADVIRRARRDRIHFHVHEHDDGTRHLHRHSHRNESEHVAHDHEHPRVGSFRALAIGLMHGMAGSTALILLTLERTQSITFGMLYMLLFGVGSILGMALLSALIAVPFRLSTSGLTGFRTGLQWVVGVGTIVLGCLTVYDSLPSDTFRDDRRGFSACGTSRAYKNILGMGVYTPRWMRARYPSIPGVGNRRFSCSTSMSSASICRSRARSSGAFRRASVTSTSGNRSSAAGLSHARRSWVQTSLSRTCGADQSCATGGRSPPRVLAYTMEGKA